MYSVSHNLLSVLPDSSVLHLPSYLFLSNIFLFFIFLLAYLLPYLAAYSVTAF